MMPSISNGVIKLVSTSVHLLNQPLVKQGIKNVAGSVTFVFGLVEVYDVYQILRGREISTESYATYPKWIQIAYKVIIVSAKISLILSAGISSPGVFIISSLVGGIFSTHQLNRVFGPNTIFVINPWHPRHIISLAAVLLALPSIAQSTYLGIHQIYKKVHLTQSLQNLPSLPRDRPGTHYWLTDAKIRLLTLFNILTSRPTLHLGNQLGRLILRPV